MKKSLAFVLLIFAVVCTTVCITKIVIEKHDNPDDVYLTIVNKTHKLPDDWLNRIELEKAKNSVDADDTFLVEKETLKHFNNLRNELLEEGIDIELDSTYRSVDEQIELWNYFREEYGEDYCKQYLATPGYSEHHTGLAIDVFLIKNGKIIRENDAMIAERETFTKVHEKLAKHGFILRYPENKDNITGYAYEPWHFRYVGKKPAEDIMSNNLTLEEYLWR